MDRVMHKVTLIARNQGQQSNTLTYSKQKKRARSLALSKTWPKNRDFHKSETPRTLQLLSKIDAAISFIVNSHREDKNAIFTEQL